MVFQWLLVLIVIATLVVIMYSDTLAGKKRHSSYFKTVQKPTWKLEREAVIPKNNQYDPFFNKLNG